MCESHFDLVDEAIEESNALKHFIAKLKVSTQPIDISLKDTAELIVGKSDLSQRGFNSLRAVLKTNNVFLPTYEKVRDYCNSLDIGIVKHIVHSELCACMGVYTEFQDTLQQIVCTETLFCKFKFLTTEQQTKLYEYLKGQDNDLYKNFDPYKRTIFIRTTGDNFRAAGKFPTEQTSFSVLNIAEMVNNPYGQFISSLWRGAESRNMLKSHVSVHHKELAHAVKNGISLFVNNHEEVFNVLAFFVADLCYVKDIIGHCQCTSTYGCFHCVMPKHEWVDSKRKTAKSKVISTMVKYGVDSLKVLGEDPNRDSKEFKAFQLNHFGQWV